MAKKIWNVQFVVGNPALFRKVVSHSKNPLSRADAIATADSVANNGGNWRVWVQRNDTGERIYQSEAEKMHVAEAAATA